MNPSGNAASALDRFEELPARLFFLFKHSLLEAGGLLVSVDVRDGEVPGESCVRTFTLLGRFSHAVESTTTSR